MRKVLVLLTLIIGTAWANTGSGVGRTSNTTAQELSKILPNNNQVKKK